jgi:AcrR family transcriptional regulator
VDPALVHHYFGAKKQLHATVLGLPAGEQLSDHLLGRVVADDMELLILDVLAAWDDPATRPTMLARLRSAAGAGATPGDYLAALFRPDGNQEQIPVPPEVIHEQVGAVAAALVGMVIARYVLMIDPLASAAADDVVALWAPTLRASVVASCQLR